MTVYLNKVLLVIIFACSAIITHSQVHVNGAATGANNGTTWADAFTELQPALNATVLGSEVWVAQGTYTVPTDMAGAAVSFEFPQDLKLYGGFAGTETSLDQRDFDTNITTISGDLNGDDTPGDFVNNRTDNALHVFLLSDTITTATVISGFVIQSGTTIDGSGSGNDRRGGAMLTFGAPQIDNCVFTQNFGWFGGGVYPRGATTSGISIKDCKFNDNAGGSGGGIYILGVTEALIENCLFEDNEVETRGGAIYVNNGTLTINEIVANRNKSTGTSTGGAIHFRSSDPNTVTINDSEFNLNSANWGGAINTYDETSTMILNDCSFESNTSVLRGGAIYMGFKARTEINDCEFSENKTEGLGGAISAQNDSTSFSVIGSDFEFNSGTDAVDADGGAIGVFGGLTMEIDDCYFEGNNGDYGGAISVTVDSLDIASLNLTNSVFFSNSAETQAAAVNIAGVPSLIENCLFNTNINNSMTGAGGAISLNTADSLTTDVVIRGCTLGGNFAPIGAGIATFTTDGAGLNVSLQNTILSNGGNNYEVESGAAVVTSIGGNFISDNTLDAVMVTTDVQQADALFVDASNLDFHLTETSPCVDAGIATDASEFDLDGVARYGEVDMGCYEFDKSVSTNTIEGFGTLSIYPNPVQDDLVYELRSEYTGDLLINITDANGRIIESIQDKKVVKNDNNIIAANQWPAGVYYLSITANNKSITTKFVKL